MTIVFSSLFSFPLHFPFPFFSLAFSLSSPFPFPSLRSKIPQIHRGSLGRARLAVDMDIHGYIHGSDFQPGFRGTLGFRGHLLRVPRLVSKKHKIT